MALSVATWLALDDQYHNHLSRKDLVTLVTACGIRCSKWPVEQLRIWVSAHSAETLCALKRLEQAQVDKNTAWLLQVQEDATKQKATPREVLSLQLNNALTVLSDAEYQQVVDLAVSLQGTRPVQLV